MKKILAFILIAAVLCSGCTKPEALSSQVSAPAESSDVPSTPAPPAPPYTLVSLGNLNASCQEDYHAFVNTLSTLDKQFIYLYITTPDGFPVANLKGFSAKSWETYSTSKSTAINGLSMNSGLLPFLPEGDLTQVQTLELVLANTDTDGDPILQRVSIPTEAVNTASPRSAVQIVWEGGSPNSTIRQCKRTLSYHTQARSPASPHPPVAGVLMNLRFYSEQEVEPTNPQVGPVPADRVYSETPAPVLYKDIFDPHYSDEAGLVTFNIGYLPPEEELLTEQSSPPTYPYTAYLFRNEIAENIFGFSPDKMGQKGCRYDVAKDKHGFVIPMTVPQDLLTNNQPYGREAVQIAKKLVEQASFLVRNVLDEPSSADTITGEDGNIYRLLPQQKYRTIAEVQEAFKNTFSESTLANTPLRSLPEWLGEGGAFLAREGHLYHSDGISLPSLNQNWYPETAADVVIGRGEIIMQMEAERNQRRSKTLKIIYENGHWVLTEGYFDYD